MNIFYLIKLLSKYKSKEYFKETILKIKPDLIHIHGTEFEHSNILNQLGNEMNIPVVVSIQGLVSVISENLYADLPLNVIHSSTIRNLFLRDNIRQLRKEIY